MQLSENRSVLGATTTTLTNTAGRFYRRSGFLISFANVQRNQERDCVGKIRFGVHFHAREGPIFSERPQVTTRMMQAWRVPLGLHLEVAGLP